MKPKNHIELDPHKESIIAYAKNHSQREVADWVEDTYDIKVSDTTICRRLQEWQEGERDKKEMPVKTKSPEIKFKPVTLADFDDAALITELRKRDYRVFRVEYERKRFGNSFKQVWKEFGKVGEPRIVTIKDK